LEFALSITEPLRGHSTSSPAGHLESCQASQAVKNLPRLSDHRLISGLTRHLVFENIALRQQLAILRRQTRRPRIRARDRVFWVTLSRL